MPKKLVIVEPVVEETQVDNPVSAMKELLQQRKEQREVLKQINNSIKSLESVIYK